MNKNKEYIQRFLGFVLLIVFTWCVLIPSSAYSANTGKIKTIQKENKSKTDQNDFVVEEELDVDVDDDDINTITTLDYFHSFTFLFHSFIKEPSHQKSTITSHKKISIPLFISFSVFRI